MSIVGNLSRHSHFSEFNSPLFTNTGVLTAAQRKALALANIGVTATAAELAAVAGVTAGTAAASKAMITNSGIGIGGGWRDTRTTQIFVQPAPAAKTTSTTLTAAELLGGLLTGNQGAAAAATYTLPLGTDLETALIAAFPGLAVNDAFEFTLINISVVAAEDITIATNTGWTLVGKMTIESNAAVTDDSRGTFRVRRTAANTYTLYRI